MTDMREGARLLTALGYTKDHLEGLEIRIIPGDNDKDATTYWPSTQANVGAVIQKADAEGRGVYFGVCRRDGKGQKEENVLEATCLWADLDGKHWDKADWRKGKELAKQKIERFLPDYLQPSIIVDSGHGYHLFWLLKEPYVFDSPGAIAHFRNTCKGIGIVLGGDSVDDIPRVMRLPGTTNAKKDTVPMPCKIVGCDPERKFDLSDFFDYVPSVDNSPGQRDNAPKPTVEELSETVGRNVALTKMAGWLRRQGVSEDVILTSLLAQNDKFSIGPLPVLEVETIAKSISQYDPRPSTNIKPDKRPVLIDHALEHRLLGSLLAFDCEPLAAVSQEITPDDLDDPDSVKVYNAILSLAGSGPVDILLLASYLAQRGDSELAGKVKEWQVDICSVDSLLQYARQLFSMAQARRLQSFALQAHHSAQELPADEAAEKSFVGLQDIIQRTNRREDGGFEEVLLRPVGYGWPTGVAEWDEWQRGLRPKTVHTIVAYTGIGKSWLMIVAAYNAAKAGARVSYFTLEMPARDIWLRLIGHVMDVDYLLLDKPEMETILSDGAAALRGLGGRLKIYDLQYTVPEMFTKVMVNKSHVAFVDYLQNVHVPGVREDNKAASNAAKELQRMAKQTDCAVVIGSQVPDEAANMYMTGMIRTKDTSVLGQASNIVLALGRDKDSTPNILRIANRKNRDGVSGKIVDYLFDLTTGILRPITKDKQPPTPKEETEWDE